MEPLPGFVTIPRLAGHVRPAGAFFSATVLAPASPGSWTIRLEGQTFTVTLPGSFSPGQVLRLKLVAQQDHRWEFQILKPDLVKPGPVPPSSLAQAFLSRGLPAASERLDAWTRWLQRPGPSDKETWAASLEARGAGPHSPLAEALSPWLSWQAALERGETLPPPDEDVWDEWNLRPTGAGDPWLVVPLRWEYEGQSDSGLLQAHWNPQRQAVDRWQVTAAPRGHGFRLEALVNSSGLDLVWRFFQAGDRAVMERWLRQSTTEFSRPELPVSLSLEGPASGPPMSRGGIDVEA